MSDERSRHRKIASNLSEEDRLKQLSQAADVRRDIEATLGTDVVNQDSLVKIAEAIWLSVPVNHRAGYTAEDWQIAIHERCTAALARAEQKMEESKFDDKLHNAKIRILRQTFAKQVVRAMQTVADHYSGKK